MADARRDLTRNELWACSLERSLTRRQRSRRTSIELWGLREPRDLTDQEVIRDSLDFARARRAAIARGPLAVPAVRGLSVLGALALSATTSTEALAAGEATNTAGTTTSSGEVMLLQRALGVTADGDFGPVTEHAVESFQAGHGLTVDGIVGPQTRSSLGLGDGPQLRPAASLHGRATGVPHASISLVRTRVQASGSGVRAVQEALGVTVDGTFGPQTETAVKAFQSAHGLTVDGVVGPATRAALGVATGPQLTEQTASSAPAAGSAGEGHTTFISLPASSTGAAGGSTSSPSNSSATAGAATLVSEMIAAGNQIATLPYIWGGGHGSFTSPGYDCSGSVSYVLHAAGLLSTPEDSSELESYGAPGPGRDVTIYADDGHAFMTIDGRRFDTVALAETGSRWSSQAADTSGYVVRHPVGL